MLAAVAQQLDPSGRSAEARAFDGALRSKIVGQEEATRTLVDLYQVRSHSF